MEKKHTVKAVMFQYKYTDLQYMILVATCQTQGGHLLKQTLLYTVKSTVLNMQCQSPLTLSELFQHQLE